MAFVAPKDRVLETSLTAGSGPWFLHGAIDGSYQAFVTFMNPGDWTIGAVVEPGVAFAAGELTFTEDSSGDPEVTLTATYASNGTFGTGTKEIFMGLPASLIFGRVAVADTNHSLAPGERLIAFTSITTARTLALLAAVSFPTGTRLLVVDESGSVSATKSITLNAAGSDTINENASAVMTGANGFIALECDGVSKWTIVDWDFTSWFASLPTSLPSASGVAWNNGGVLSLS